MEKIIYGIQQVGVGVPDAMEGFRWYGKVLGSDIKIFDDDNVATYMAPYMGGNPHKKRAILAANIQGGSCYEIWQFMDRIPESPAEEPALGDMGIYAVKVKAKNIHEARQSVLKKGAKVLSDVQLNPDDQPFFFMEDLFGNKIQVIESYEWFKPMKRYTTGGVYGCMIGVSDMERSLIFYKEILGYDMVIYDLTKVFPDLAGLKGGDRKIRRVLLTHSAERRGSMAALLGRSQIELIQVQSSTSPRKIFEGRYWGDIGFIHLCFDIHGMAALKEECARKGFPFTVESDDAFKMGEAAGHWSYTEDPDGTLIEFVETKKIPLVKKWNWYLNLEKRNPYKPLPRWMIRALSLNRVKM